MRLIIMIAAIILAVELCGAAAGFREQSARLAALGYGVPAPPRPRPFPLAMLPPGAYLAPRCPPAREDRTPMVYSHDPHQMAWKLGELDDRATALNRDQVLRDNAAAAAYEQHEEAAMDAMQRAGVGLGDRR